MESETSYDVIVIGSGASGLSAALTLAPKMRVALLSKGALRDGNTVHAQGGVAAVMDENDSIDSHIEDTLKAGAGLCDPDVVRFVVENGRRAVERLISLGVNFSRRDDCDKYHLTREGGHSRRRVIHAADATGEAIEKTLEERVRAEPGISVLENHSVIDLIAGEGPAKRCLGAYALDTAARRVKLLSAKTVVLATGGASKVYLYTTNPDCSTGDGIAMAWRAGCRVANMEFSQFHPTCLFHPQAKSFLITESVRGEGGRLLLNDGSRFMDRFHKDAELAPRDIVARAIDHEIKRLGIDCVYLDISHKPREFIESHFPTVYHNCLKFGFDMTSEPLPVVPAAHYTCGGVVVDMRGRTDIDGLYAIGETACTGLHGANRMASNSLLECLVFSEAAAKDIIENIRQTPAPPPLPEWDESLVANADEEVVVSHNWEELRRSMWDYVGIVRTDKRLERAQRRVDLLLGEIAEYYGNFRVTGDLLELRNLALVADLIIRSAAKRKESRGLHYTLDYPTTDNSRPPKNTILIPKGFAK
ncbi:MAG: L-aspartate oxidase [Rhodospirillales bacterium RIFCSPLOWO2_12_FULL_58_28]|nr:MAG: L-aspartate oxidase [Rhodospirillales bacterium RIFCSPLOWO2_02_FULL_58_16]OHC79354.1 MAG: L-aspartate oxidase [Rhodospirillales bacterium RIFCSPLOWO2_12_FULL_58_28]